MPRGIGWFLGSVVRYRRAIAREALSRSFPEKSPQAIRTILLRIYAHMGMKFVEMMRLPHLMTEAAAHEVIAVEGADNLREAHKQGKGVVALCGHIGNWELLATVTPLWGYPLTIIARAVKNATRQEGIFVEFFGKPACTTPGLAYMAAQVGPPIVPAFILRASDTRRHVIRTLPAIEPPREITPESVRSFTQQCTTILEQIIREHPEQWTWIHRRWRTVPWKGADRSGYQPPG